MMIGGVYDGVSDAARRERLAEREMNLQDLRYLVAIAEHRHFGRAAESCNVSQPTLSSQIKKLEDELGVTLLERTNKRVDMTPVGGQILAHAKRALAEAAQMEAVARPRGRNK